MIFATDPKLYKIKDSAETYVTYYSIEIKDKIQKEINCEEYEDSKVRNEQMGINSNSFKSTAPTEAHCMAPTEPTSTETNEKKATNSVQFERVSLQVTKAKKEKEREKETETEQDENFKKDYYYLKLKINKFVFTISKFILVLNYRSIKLNPLLFLPKRILARQPYVLYQHRWRYFKKKAVLKKVVPNLNRNLKTNPSADNGSSVAVGGAIVDKLKISAASAYSYGENDIKLTSNSNTNKRILLLQNLITDLLKQGIILNNELSFLIKTKKRSINNLISLKNIKNIEPVLLKKIRKSIFIATKNFISLPPDYRPYVIRGEGHSSGGGAEPLLIRAGSPAAHCMAPGTEGGEPCNGPQQRAESHCRSLSLQKQKQELALNKKIVLNKEVTDGKILNKNKILIPINPGSDPSQGSPIAEQWLRTEGYNVSKNLDIAFEAPKLTNLPFSLLFYNKNKKEIINPYKKNLELKLETIPFVLLFDKNTELKGKNAVKLSSVTSHFDLEKNNTRDTVQPSAISSPSSFVLNPTGGTGALALQQTVKNLVDQPVLSHYFKELSIYNMRNKGIIIFYYILIGFHFNTDLNKFYTSGKKNIYKLLAAFFKSMYCLISKPVFICTPDKIILQLFYYLFIPNVLKFKKFLKNKNKNKNTQHLDLSVGQTLETVNNYDFNSNREAIVKNKKRLKSKNSLLLRGTKFITLLRRRQRRKLLTKKREINLIKKKIRKQYNKFRKIKINVRVKLRKLSNMSLVKVFPNKFKFLSLILNNIFKKPVVFDLVRIHYPYNDSNILVNLLGIMINKIKLRIIIRRFFEKAIIKNINKFKEKTGVIIPSFLSGLTIRVAGRLLTHKVVPRQTVKTTSRGASAPGRINFKDIATYTNKNKRGAYSITVKAGQNLI